MHSKRAPAAPALRVCQAPAGISTASPGATSLLAVDLHQPAAVEEEVDLFGDTVVVPFRRLAGGERRLGEALVAHQRGRREPEQLTYRRAVLRRERLGGGAVPDLHVARIG